MSNITYHFKLNNSWPQLGLANLRKGLMRMVLDIHRGAVQRAPKKSRALANSGRFRKTGNLSYEVSFGGPRVPYAALRERENHLHPATTHYLGNSMKAVAAKQDTYFQNLI